MGKNSAYLALALTVVVVAAVLSVKLFVKDDPAGEASPGGGSVPTVAPPRGEPARSSETPALEPIIITPPPPGETVSVLTPIRPETEPPAETPTEAPVIETTAPDGGGLSQPVSADASGTFNSETGTYLNMTGNWTVYTDASGARKLEVALSATHYSIQCDGLTDALELNVNGQTYLADSPSIRYDGKGFVSTPLYTFTVDAPAGAMRITATWHYRGSYSGKSLEDITASYTYYG